METKSEVCSDALTTFCQSYISQNTACWPTDETKLASVFVKFFRLPLLGHVGTLEGFAVQTRIILIETELPGNLLGMNVSFEGKKQILYSGHRRHIHSPVHTVLHEIRELLENEFRRLGFATIQTRRGLEKRADRFACAAFLESGVPELQHWISKTSEIESKWRKFGGFALIVICGLLFILFSHMGAYYYYCPPKRRISRNRGKDSRTGTSVKRAVQQSS
jgi:hypothetical protein